jgi:hypothetical protein
MESLTGIAVAAAENKIDKSVLDSSLTTSPVDTEYTCLPSCHRASVCLHVTLAFLAFLLQCRAVRSSRFGPSYLHSQYARELNRQQRPRHLQSVYLCRNTGNQQPARIALDHH